MTRELAQVETPIGAFRAVVVDGSVRTAGFLRERGSPRVERDSAGVRDALAAYFDGDIDALDAIAVAPQGTEFKQLVWKALREGQYDPERSAITTFVYAVANNAWLSHLRGFAREQGFTGAPTRAASSP